MRNLLYLTAPPHNCPEHNSNDKAFVHMTTTIGGRDTWEEFMASKILLLSAGLSFGEVVEDGMPVSKVLVRLPKFDVVKPDDVSGEASIVKIAACADKLIGRYSWREHKACVAQIPTICLNRVFEYASIKYGAHLVRSASATV
jgi:hypothetical protein